MYRLENDGQSWHTANDGLHHRHIRWLAVNSDGAFAGTEPAGIFISRNSGMSWHECSQVAQLRDSLHWSLPYSPEAGCVRGFAFQGSRVYAAVEVGGVLRSDDGGSSWGLAEGSDGQPTFTQPAEPQIHPDVHSIYTHPTSPDLVYAPTGRGLYRSLDGGKTWRNHYYCYVRAAWINPVDPEHILLGPARGVDRDGRIEESWDGGATWQPASEGLPAPWPQTMVERFAPIGEQIAAVLSNGEVLIRPLQSGAWQWVLAEIVGVNAITQTSAISP
jgi:photosystem II stability/assembly factor-like uncharacterized protein